MQSPDIAILNVGLYNVHESFGSTGYEESIHTNHLSNIPLVLVLLPIVKGTRSGNGPGCIVLVTSDTATSAMFEERKLGALLPVSEKKLTN